jgi:hypothetical protein
MYHHVPILISTNVFNYHIYPHEYPHHHDISIED